MKLPLKAGQTQSGHPFWVSDSNQDKWLAVTHGSFGDHRDFVEVLAPLRERYNFLLWDLPGHGENRTRALRRLPHIADALREVMDEAAVASAHQLGFSFGGMAAQSFARAYPERTASLIAYACVPITMSPVKGTALLNFIAQTQLALTPWNAFCRAFAGQASVSEPVQQEFASRMRPQRAALRNAIYEAMIFGASKEPGFRYRLPVAQIKGACDDRFPGAKPQMDAWSATLPSDLVVEIAGAGHLAHFEQPEAFTNALSTLLARLERA